MLNKLQEYYKPDLPASIVTIAFLVVLFSSQLTSPLLANYFDFLLFLTLIAATTTFYYFSDKKPIRAVTLTTALATGYVFTSVLLSFALDFFSLMSLADTILTTMIIIVFSSGAYLLFTHNLLKKAVMSATTFFIALLLLSTFLELVISLITMYQQSIAQVTIYEFLQQVQVGSLVAAILLTSFVSATITALFFGSTLPTHHAWMKEFFRNKKAVTTAAVIGGIVSITYLLTTVISMSSYARLFGESIPTYLFIEEVLYAIILFVAFLISASYQTKKMNA